MDIQELAEYIKKSRIVKGVKQKEMAEKLGLSAGRYSNYENGSRPIPSSILFDLFQFLGLNWYDFPGIAKDRGAAYWIDLKLSRFGISIQGDYAAAIWLDMPDGTFELAEGEIEKIDAEADEFLRFKLDQLIKANPDRFKPKKTQ